MYMYNDVWRFTLYSLEIAMPQSLPGQSFCYPRIQPVGGRLMWDAVFIDENEAAMNRAYAFRVSKP